MVSMSYCTAVRFGKRGPKCKTDRLKNERQAPKMKSRRQNRLKADWDKSKKTNERHTKTKHRTNCKGMWNKTRNTEDTWWAKQDWVTYDNTQKQHEDQNIQTDRECTVKTIKNRQETNKDRKYKTEHEDETYSTKQEITWFFFVFFKVQKFKQLAPQVWPQWHQID